jgi:hypothetical protein
MSVFTLYCCGTDYHRGSHDVVAQLYEETASDCAINDGIGSVPDDGGGAHTAADGELHVNWRNKLAEMILPGHTPMMGSAFGVDIDNNVAAGLYVIHQRLKKDRNLRVNMLGWSRGAVTCYKIANAMHRMTSYGLDGIRVRIFAIDPVPGGTSFNNHVRRYIRMTSNVVEAQVILAQHERRWMFRPVLPESERNGVQWDIMPGNHSSIVEKKEGLKPAYRLVRHLAKEFLMERDGGGTMFGADDGVLLPLEILENYSKIYRRWFSFEDTGAQHWFKEGYRRPWKIASGSQPWKFTSFITRKRKVQSQDPRKHKVMVLRPQRGFSGDDFFINKHHREVFRSLYEALYLEMHQHRPFADDGRVPAWQTAVSRLVSEAPKTFGDLLNHFGQDEGSLLSRGLLPTQF